MMIPNEINFMLIQFIYLSVASFCNKVFPYFFIFLIVKSIK